MLSSQTETGGAGGALYNSTHHLYSSSTSGGVYRNSGTNDKEIANGSFWMSFSDFLFRFSRILVAEDQADWAYTSYTNVWKGGVPGTPGVPDGVEDCADYPQYTFSIYPPDNNSAGERQNQWGGDSDNDDDGDDGEDNEDEQTQNASRNKGKVSRSSSLHQYSLSTTIPPHIRSLASSTSSTPDPVTARLDIGSSAALVSLLLRSFKGYTHNNKHQCVMHSTATEGEEKGINRDSGTNITIDNSSIHKTHPLINRERQGMAKLGLGPFFPQLISSIPALAKLLHRSSRLSPLPPAIMTRSNMDDSGDTDAAWSLARSLVEAAMFPPRRSTSSVARSVCGDRLREVFITLEQEFDPDGVYHDMTFFVIDIGGKRLEQVKLLRYAHMPNLDGFVAAQRISAPFLAEYGRSYTIIPCPLRAVNKDTRFTIHFKSRLSLKVEQLPHVFKT